MNEPTSKDELDEWKPIFVNGVIPTEFRDWVNQKCLEAERKIHVSYMRMAESIIDTLGQDHPIQAQSIIDYAKTSIAELQSQQKGQDNDRN
jgi:hypothetical protein